MSIIQLKLIIVGKKFRNNSKNIFLQRFIIMFTKNNCFFFFKSSGTFGSSLQNYHEIYNNYLNKDLCKYLVNPDEDIFLPGFYFIKSL